MAEPTPETIRQLQETVKQLLEFADLFTNIANAIVAFAVLQTVALLFSFIKDDRLIASLYRWRPYSSLLTVWTVVGYVSGIIICGIMEFLLRNKAPQHPLILIGCVVMVALKCIAIISAGLVYLKIYIQICRERDWHNHHDLAEEIQTPRLKLDHSKLENYIYRLAEIVDKELFKAKIEEELAPKKFPNISTPHPIKENDESVKDSSKKVKSPIEKKGRGRLSRKKIWIRLNKSKRARN